MALQCLSKNFFFVPTKKQWEKKNAIVFLFIYITPLMWILYKGTTYTLA